MMPSKHFCPASNTPDPELPVVATSRITVENLFWNSAGSNDGNIEGGLLSVLVLGAIRKSSDRTREEDPKPALSSNTKLRRH
jgi:hypothetical protein